MTDTMLLRIGIAVAMALLLGVIVWFGRAPKPAKRRTSPRLAPADARVEPVLGDGAAYGEAVDLVAAEHQTTATAATPQAPGRRAADGYDRIVSLYVAAKAGNLLRGPDILVAAEKAGLTFGDMEVFHRLLDGRADSSPVFSVANIVRPGSFDMATIGELETPAITFFLTLPAPVQALEAWDMMLPAAQRMAELLDGIVLDEDRNALGRQRIAYIRDELRAYDRQQQAAAPLPLRR